MSSEDYMMRYFRQLGKVLAALTGYREKRKYELAIQEINQVLDTWFAIGIEEMDAMTEDELVDLLFETGSETIDKGKTVAELLYQKTITYIEMEKLKEAIPFAQKALALFKSVDERSGEFSIEIQQRIADLDGILSGAVSA